MERHDRPSASVCICASPERLIPLRLSHSQGQQCVPTEPPQSASRWDAGWAGRVVRERLAAWIGAELHTPPSSTASASRSAAMRRRGISDTLIWVSFLDTAAGRTWRPGWCEHDQTDGEDRLPNGPGSLCGLNSGASRLVLFCQHPVIRTAWSSYPVGIEHLLSQRSKWQ